MTAARAAAPAVARARFRSGLAAGLPFVLVIVPFGMVFGVVAIDSGLTLAQTLGFSVLVIAGAAQLAALQMMVEGAPMAVVVLTALTVNLRMAMYSASLAPHLGRAGLGARMLVAWTMVDQAYAVAFLQFERAPGWPVAEKLAWYLGAVAPVVPTWFLGTALGAVLGDRLPGWLPLDFFVPITFLAMVGPMLRTWAHGVAAAVSVGATLLLAGVPWNLGLPLAGLLAMTAGALTEIAASRRHTAAPGQGRGP